MFVARKYLLDGFKLKQQVVAEGAHQPQAGILFAAELFDQRPQNGERRGLLAALLLGKQGRKRFQAAIQHAVLPTEFLPMRMPLERRMEQLRDAAAALIERAELHAAVARHDLQRRTGGGDVPARVPPGILVSRRQVDATVPVQIAQEVPQALTVTGPG